MIASRVRWLLLGAIIIISGSILLFSKKASTKSNLPYYGPVQIKNQHTNSPDTVFHRIGDFTFVNQFDNPVSADNFKDNIVLANFFFSSCDGICPLMTETLSKIAAKYSNNDDVRIISFSIDPEEDSSDFLGKYAKQNKIQGKQWMLLTGNKQKIHQLAKNSFLTDIHESKEGSTAYIHPPTLTLVDKNRHIRGIYNITQKAEVDNLLSDIEALLGERKQW